MERSHSLCSAREIYKEGEEEMNWKNMIFIIGAFLLILLVLGYNIFLDWKEKDDACISYIEPAIKVDSFYYSLSDDPFVIKRVYGGNLNKSRLKKIFSSWEMEKVEEYVKDALLREGVNARVDRLMPKIPKNRCGMRIYVGLEIKGNFGKYDKDQFFELILGPYAH